MTPLGRTLAVAAVLMSVSGWLAWSVRSESTRAIDVACANKTMAEIIDCLSEASYQQYLVACCSMKTARHCLFNIYWSQHAKDHHTRS